MEPVKIIENKELLLAGCLVKYDGRNEWDKWEEYDQKGNNDEKYIHHHLVNGHQGHSLWFHLDNSYVFTGLEVTKEAFGTAWEYLKVPTVTYAVFDLDYKTDLDPQYYDIEKWVEKQKDVYEWAKWDADGKVEESKFSIYLYDHGGKFKENRIVEFWIPLNSISKT